MRCSHRLPYLFNVFVTRIFYTCSSTDDLHCLLTQDLFSIHRLWFISPLRELCHLKEICNLVPRAFLLKNGWGGKRHFVKLLTKFNFFFELFLLIEGAFVSSFGIRTKNTQCSCNSRLLRLLEQWNADSIVLYLTSSKFR